ncbi:MAG: hypothetical protein HN736_10050 [Anaerolineae bacterium]|jgi:hypothetical protein|nr:hypothetical protein [Anaerolineae bacterium]MBT4312400.1 hypothetical protein [Anaerolineae bacterium]MBT4459358.1 hypothetical protein [Anaerolineae bacterium]MBT4841041.1 hypothetical protein [Anaerolineae bacterium]MBT6062282.1 hypothetical protein [Anaerolineae bacterium]
MKYLIPFILIISILLSGCSALGAAAPAADATATISAEDIRATADVMVYDMLTQTQAAMPPTNTPLPPTNPPPTATIAIPTLSVLDGSPTVSAIGTISTTVAIPTNTKTSSGGFACTEQPLLEWTGDSVQLSVTNNVKNSTANVFLCITTPYGEAGYISVPLVKSNSVQIPYGIVSATAWVDGEKKDFNAHVGFEVKNSSNIQLVIENGQIFFRAGCAPNC